MLRARVAEARLAMLLLTRIPVGYLRDPIPATGASAWGWPLAGAVAMLPAALIYWALHAAGFGPTVAALGLIFATTLLTGAMHEDGLADCADGFWGGFAPARRLEIMKDSQIGSYGVLALVFAIGLRWHALSLLLDLGQGWSALAIALLSRAMMPMLMVWLPNARQSGLSQSVGRPSRRATALGLGLAVALALPLLGFVSLAGYGILRATAHTKLLNFASNVGGLAGFMLVASPLWALGLAMGAAQIAGAYVGSTLASRIGSKLIKPVLVIASTALAIKLMTAWF